MLPSTDLSLLLTTMPTLVNSDCVTTALDNNPFADDPMSDVKKRRVPIKRSNISNLPKACYVTPMVRNYAELVRSSRNQVSVDKYSNPAVGFVMIELSKPILTDDNKMANQKKIYSIPINFRTDDPEVVLALRDGFKTEDIVAALAQNGAHGKMYRMTRIPDEDIIETYEEDMFSADVFDRNAPFVEGAPREKSEAISAIEKKINYGEKRADPLNIGRASVRGRVRAPQGVTVPETGVSI